MFKKHSEVKTILICIALEKKKEILKKPIVLFAFFQP